MNNHIVYAGWLDGTCVYVGEGKPKRYMHLNSGVSHVYEANAIHFKGREIVIKILHQGLSKEESLKLEADYIEEFIPAWNKKEFKHQIPNKRIETILREACGKTLALSKVNSSIKVIKYLFTQLNKSYKTTITRGQIERAIGIKSPLSHLLSDFAYLPIGKVFDVSHSGQDYLVVLKQDWVDYLEDRLYLKE
jgi:hypothetical protein